MLWLRNNIIVTSQKIHYNLRFLRFQKKKNIKLLNLWFDSFHVLHGSANYYYVCSMAIAKRYNVL